MFLHTVGTVSFARISCERGRRRCPVQLAEALEWGTGGHVGVDDLPSQQLGG